MNDNGIGYANGYSFLLSKENGEAIITFTQNQPVYNAENGEYESKGRREVATLVLPYHLLVELYRAFGEAIENEESKGKAVQLS